MEKIHSPRLRAFVTLAIPLLACAPDAAAQGCAMCYTSAEQAGGGGALNLAILVLLVPTLSLFVGVLVFASRRRSAEVDDADERRDSSIPSSRRRAA